MSECLYFLRYWAIPVLQLFVSQVVTSKIMKSTLFSNQAVFLNDQKVKTKIWISWEEKELLRLSKEIFFIIFKGLSVAKNCLRPNSAPLIQIALCRRNFCFYKSFCSYQGSLLTKSYEIINEIITFSKSAIDASKHALKSHQNSQ